MDGHRFTSRIVLLIRLLDARRAVADDADRGERERRRYRTPEGASSPGLSSFRADRDRRDLLESIRAETAATKAAIRSHRWLEALERGGVPPASLQAFAGEQWSILQADPRSFAELAARFAFRAGGGPRPRARRGRGARAGAPARVRRGRVRRGHSVGVRDARRRRSSSGRVR